MVAEALLVGGFDAHFTVTSLGPYAIRNCGICYRTRRSTRSKSASADGRRPYVLERWPELLDERHGPMVQCAKMSPRSAPASAVSQRCSDASRRYWRTVADYWRFDRWRDGEMTLRWVASALSDASVRFRRLRGHRDMKALITALEARCATFEPLALKAA